MFNEILDTILRHKHCPQLIGNDIRLAAAAAVLRYIAGDDDLKAGMQDEAELYREELRARSLIDEDTGA